MKYKKTFFLALNEFNEELVESIAKENHLPNVSWLFEMHRSKTFTDDVYESDFLEPWVQWVSIHTSVPASNHKIKHLGDVPTLDHPQIWERLSEKGITTGIWGAMNASKGNSDHTLFFLPDPWTVTENAYPSSLNSLLGPLRYFAQNYLKRSKRKTLAMARSLFSVLASNHLLSSFLSKLPKLLFDMVRYKGKPFVLICFFDYLSTLLFLRYRSKYNPDFTMIFVNSIAHLQHHQWKKDRKALTYGLKNLDKILKLMRKELRSDERIMVANALSQQNTDRDTPWILYRQIDQAAFLQAIGVKNFRVEPHMTHDAHIFFDHEKDAREALSLLEKSAISNKPLFHIETYSNDPKKLFYKIIFTDKVGNDESFKVGNKEFSFFSLFKPVVQRTGKHIQEGSLFSNDPSFKKEMMNHEIFEEMERLLDPSEQDRYSQLAPF